MFLNRVLDYPLDDGDADSIPKSVQGFGLAGRDDVIGGATWKRNALQASGFPPGKSASPQASGPDLDDILGRRAAFRRTETACDAVEPNIEYLFALPATAQSPNGCEMCGRPAVDQGA